MASRASSPVLVLNDVVDPIGSLDVGVCTRSAFVLAVAGIAVVFAAQMGMGTSWRIGVSNEQETDLVTGGLFSLSRNPIYAAMVTAWVGFFLMVPTIPALAGALVIAIALQGQVRLVEEPFMRPTSATAMPTLDYERRVGRFLPGIGRAR